MTDEQNRIIEEMYRFKKIGLLVGVPCLLLVGVIALCVPDRLFKPVFFTGIVVTAVVLPPVLGRFLRRRS